MTDPDTKNDHAVLALLEVLKGILSDYEGTIDQIKEFGSAEISLGPFERIRTAHKILDRIQQELPDAA